jgi:DNA polymerase-1
MKVLAVDGNSILNRAFYGIRLLSTKDGRFTNGIYGFMNILINLLETYEPDSVCVAFDLKAPTFRHAIYTEYKAGRHAPPSELVEQFPTLKELLSALGYAVIEKEGYEADDILGTLSKKCGREDFCYIVTGDKDALQLVKENCLVLLASTKAGQPVTVVYDEERIMEEYRVKPPLLIDIKAVMGDSSDNIPGVKGIGQKGAFELISNYGAIRDIYENIDEINIKESMREKLKEQKEQAFLSYELGAICKNVPDINDISSLKLKPADKEQVTRILASLEMYKTLERILPPVSSGVVCGNKSDSFPIRMCRDNEELLERLKASGKAYFDVKYDGTVLELMVFNLEGELLFVTNDNLTFMEFAQKLFSSPGIKKYTTDIKKLYSFCDEMGIEIRNIGLDSSIAGYLLNPNASSYSVVNFARTFSLPDVKIEAPQELTELLQKNEQVVNSAAFLPSVCLKLISEIEKNYQKELLFDIEIPLAQVLSSMEREGFKVNAAGIEQFGNELEEKIKSSLSVIYGFAGREFNVNSPKQLGEILFSEGGLRLPHGKKTKTGYSTNAQVLEFLKDRHPIIPELLSYRTLSKLKSTYCEGLLKVIDNDGRIHSTLNQTETRTGRISSAEPNLQNIPVKSDLGRELRRFFVAGAGKVLIDADYSQIELRVLAALAEDETMIRAFNNEEDIHAITASQVFGVPLAEVTPHLRNSAKAVNFGIVYGIGAFSLSEDLGVSVAQADRYIKSYLANYAGVRAYMEKMRSIAKEKGYAETLFKRRRYLPELSSSNANIRAFGERVAMNMPIQGTAADIIKIAMVKVYERLRSENMKSKLILQVHDELIVESPEEEADMAAIILKEEMETACKLKVKLKADLGVGESWYEAKE